MKEDKMLGITNPTKCWELLIPPGLFFPGVINIVLKYLQVDTHNFYFKVRKEYFRIIFFLF